MRNRKSIDALALAACLVSAGIVALSIWDLPPNGDSKIYSEIGSHLARQALDLLPAGGQISVLARDTEAYRQPAMDISLKEFRKQITRAGGSINTHFIQLDPLRPVEIPPGDFYETIRRAKSNDVIVSFLGPPVLAPEQRAKLGVIKPKIVALCTGSLAEQIDLPGLFKGGLLHAAIVNRQTSSTGAAASASQSFDQLYAVVRADELSNRMSQIP